MSYWTKLLLEGSSATIVQGQHPQGGDSIG